MIFALIGIIICIVFAVIGVKKEKLIINPLTVFCAVFGSVFICSVLQLYTLYKAKDNTYLIFLIGTIFFIIGYFLKNLIENKILKYSESTKLEDNNVKDNTKINKYVPRYTLLYIICIICSIFYLVNLIIVLQNIEGFSLYNVQKILQGGEIDYGYPPIIRALTLLIFNPAYTAILAITATDFWFGRKDKKLIILTFVMMILKMLSSASRSGFISFVIFAIITGLIYIFNEKKKSKDKSIEQNLKKQKKKIVIILSIGIILFLIMTISRKANIFKNIYLNFGMVPIMFERWKEVVDKKEIIGFGEATLNGIIYPVFYIIKNLMGIPIPHHIKEIYEIIMLTDSVWQPIGTKLTANAYVSVFWFFYLDARIFGVAIGSLIYGFLCKKVYTKAINEPSSKNIAIFCLIFYSYLYSFVRIQFAMINFVFALLYIITVFYKKKAEKEEDSNKIRVLFVENAGLLSAGAFHSLVALVELLKERGVDCYIAMPDRADGISLLKEKNIKYITLRACSYSQMISLNASHVEQIKMILKDILVKFSALYVAKFVKENNIDIIHENTSACYIGRYVAKLTDIKHIWHIREFMEEDFNATLWKKKKALKEFEKADAVIAISKAIYNKYALHLNNIICIYNGIDEKKFLDENKEILNSDILNIVSVGRICEGKGQKTLVEAIKLLKEKNNIKVNAILAGLYSKDDEYYKAIMNIIQENNLEDSVKLIGQCNNILEIYKESDIFCMTSKFEAFGRVTVEAMMAGCLVVGGNAGGTREIIEGDITGILFESENSEGLAEKLYYVITEKEKMKNVCKNGQKSALEKFTAKRNADEIYELYCTILNSDKERRE